MKKTNLIDLVNITKTYRTPVVSPGFRGTIKALLRPQFEVHHALTDINFQLGSGNMLALLGANGAGKSTIVKLLSGIQKADSGIVKTVGLDPRKHRRLVFSMTGVVFGHKSSLWWDLPLIESLRLSKHIYNISNADFDKRLPEIIERLLLSHKLNAPVRSLSLGERVKAELAFNLLYKPRLLILDEPTLGLDIMAKHEIRELLKAATRNDGAGCLITTHDMGDIEGYVDSVVLLHRGSMRFEGSLRQLKTLDTPLTQLTVYCQSITQLNAAVNHLYSFKKSYPAAIEYLNIDHTELLVEVLATEEGYRTIVQHILLKEHYKFSISPLPLETILRTKLKKLDET